MNVGMLWFDNNPKMTLENKVGRAAAYYQDKYGKTPTLCFVHPSMVVQADIPAQAPAKGGSVSEDVSFLVAPGVEVRSTQSVLPNHFWIGVNGKNGNGAN